MNKDGIRQMAYPMQGRNTLGSKEDAKDLLKSFIKNNPPDTLESIYGSQSKGTFEVSAIECYERHNDPVGVFIQEKHNPGQVIYSDKMKALL